MSDLRTHAEEIASQFSDHLDLTVDEVEERLDNLVNEYRVPVDEARRSVTNSYLDEAGMERDDLGRGGTQEVKLGDPWEPRSDSISQVGLVGDESGTKKFVAFTTSDLPELEEGKSYKLSN